MLKIKQLQQTKRELFESLETFTGCFISRGVGCGILQRSSNCMLRERMVSGCCGTCRAGFNGGCERGDHRDFF